MGDHCIIIIIRDNEEFQLCAQNSFPDASLPYMF